MQLLARSRNSCPRCDRGRLIERLPIVASERGRQPGLQPWDCIEVYGAAASERVRAAFAAIGAFDIVATKLGFFARRR